MESQSTFLQRNQCKSQSRLFDQFYCNLRFHKGSDVQTVWRLSVAMQFQSTLPRRERPGCRIFLKSYLDISIHAPTKGATLFVAVKVWYPMKISIHAPTKGATQATQNAIGYVQFQSTLPRRERQNSGVPRSIDNVFQSTLPRRERQNPSHTAQHHQHISIHAPTKGAT